MAIVGQRLPNYKNQPKQWSKNKMVKDRVEKDPKKINPSTLAALYKVVMIGESGVGKTSMLLRFTDNTFNPLPFTTVGVDFKLKTLRVDDKLIKLQVWDTAGQERYRSISQAYFRNTNGCIAVYDINSRTSFESLEQQILTYLSFQSKPSMLGAPMTNKFKTKKMSRRHDPHDA